MLKGLGIFTAAAVYLLLGAIIVLVITHAPAFSSAVSAVGGTVNTFAQNMTGQAPVTGGIIPPGKAPGKPAPSPNIPGNPLNPCPAGKVYAGGICL